MNLIPFQALRLSSFTRRSTTVGQIVNLMSVDAQKIQDMAYFLDLTWGVAFCCVIMVAALSIVVGTLPALSGFLVMLILIPFNSLFLGSKIGTMQVFINLFAMFNE